MGALNVLSLEIPGKKDILQHSTVPLAELLHSERETQYLTETCVQLCRCASELPAFRFSFAKHVLKSIWLLEKVYGVTSIAAVHATRHFLTKTPPARGDEIRVPPVCPLERIDSPAMFAIEECTGILHNLLFLLGEDMPQDAQGPALDCLDVLTQEVKAQQELLEVIESGERPVADALYDAVVDMCHKVVKVEAAPEPEEADTAEAGAADTTFSYRAEGELLKFDGGAFEWTRENNESGEEYLVSGNYSTGDEGMQLVITTVHYRSEGQEDFSEVEVAGTGLITASFVGSDATVEIGPSEQWPEALPIKLEKEH